ncbi:hypothetical protein PIB30_071355 [Stylosanthes scabra]|uniref:Uncharacterized protein n=1 Tax=Stylosanthes scabra TaxID=79078 RepID=A0ABU6XLJ9_9FABA|nr:hypothetical protein [Stylosanthes scabra]
MAFFFYNEKAPIEDNTAEKLHRTSQLSEASSQHVSHPESSSESGVRAGHSEIRLFRPPRDKASSDLSDSVENRHPHERCTTHVNQAVVNNTDTEDEDYVPDADEMASFYDHIDNLFADHDVKEQNKGKKRMDNKSWEVKVIEDGVIRPLKQTVFGAASIPPGRKIVLRFNESNQAVGDEGGLLSGYLGSLGADFKTFPISMKGWHEMKEYKESVYNDVIKTFHFEDLKGKIKKDILKRLGKLWKDTRSNLFHTFYDDTKSINENVKKHKPRGVDPEH